MDPATVIAGVSTALQGAHLAHQLGQKYIPGVKRSATKLFSSKSRTTAKNYLKGLASFKGITKAVTKDLPSVAKKGVKLLKSGDVLKKAQGVAGDVKAVTGFLDQSGLGGKHTKAINDAADRGISTIQHHHDLANKYVSDFEHAWSQRPVQT